MKELLSFFTNYVFVGVFQYDSGTPKHALELKKRSDFFGFCPKELNLYGLELKVQEVIYRVLNSFQWFFFQFVLFVSSVKPVLGRMASTAISKHGPYILIAHGTTEGGGTPDPLVVKDY